MNSPSRFGPSACARRRGQALAILVPLAILVGPSEARAAAPRRPPPLAVVEPPVAARPGVLDGKRADAAVNKKEWAKALSLFDKAWQEGLRIPILLAEAGHAAAALGKKAEALAWLKRAVDNGYESPAGLLEDEDLRDLRGDPTFVALARRPGTPRPGGPMSPKMQRILEADQGMREGPLPPDKSVAAEAFLADDRSRRVEVTRMIAAGELKTGADHWAASLVFQHGEGLEDFARARDLALKAVRLGDLRGISMATLTWDRWLDQAGYQQRFGTQYRYDEKTGISTLLPVEPSVTDVERARWEVLPLAEIPVTTR